MNGVEKERLVRDLAASIDADSPPGMAANILAREVVSLVQDREPAQAIALSESLASLARDGRFGR